VPVAVQILGCYLVVEEPPDELLRIDQHARHQRIVYERLRARLAAGPVECQRLLAPEPVEVCKALRATAFPSRVLHSVWVVR
jgi:DNA mismatch repair protein MutL